MNVPRGAIYNEPYNMKAPAWKNEYRRLQFEEKLRKFPNLYKPGDESKYEWPLPSDRKANGLTKLIVGFLKLKGHHANRINTQGQARTGKVQRYEAFSNKAVYDQQIRWTKSTTTKGTADIDAIIFGKSVKIEVKIGRDKMSEDQLRYQVNVEKAGGLYYVARDMQSFYEWYINTFEK